MHRRSLLLALTFGAALVGCGPPWHVIRQAAPDPFLGQRRFSVLPIDFGGLRIGNKPEEVYLAEKDAKQQASFAEDKAALNEQFLQKLVLHGHELGLDIVPATGPADAPFLIRPSVQFIEPGFYVGVAASPSHVEMMVRITAPDGKVLDEIAIDHGTQSGMVNPSSGQRLRSDGAGLGAGVAGYLATRVSPGGG
jgi:hypothetical protein